MTDTLKAVADTTSWFIVDPETYRYFFSASAQVFAAIFAVVAIAYSFRIEGIRRELEDISRRKKRLLLSSLSRSREDARETIFSDALSIKIHSTVEEAVHLLDDRAIDVLLKKVKEIYEAKSSGRNLTPGSYYGVMTIPKDVIDSIDDAEHNESAMRTSKSNSVRNVKTSVIVAATMTCLSLLMFLLEKFFCSAMIIACCMIYVGAIIVIAWLFITTFSQK